MIFQETTLPNFLKRYSYNDLILNDGRGSRMVEIISRKEPIPYEDITILYMLKLEGPIAWAWLIERKHERVVIGNVLEILELDILEYLCYIKEKYRRQGIGKYLYKSAVEISNKKSKQILTNPHDDVSKNYFEYCDRIQSSIKDWSAYC